MKLKLAIKWGIIFFLFNLIWLALEKFTGLHGKYIEYQMWITNLAFIGYIIIFRLGILDYKKQEYSGDMSWLQGFLSGLWIALISAILAPLATYISVEWISPEFFPNAIKGSVELGYYETTEAASEFFNTQNYLIQTAIGTPVMCAILSAIIAIFVRTKQS